jgi:DNA-binding transcriptional LysR family regulator
VFLGKSHPLAKKKIIKPAELDDYPYLTYEQGVENALYFTEEVMPAIDRRKNIRVRDRATMTNLLLGLNGFTVASGVHSKAYNPQIISVPLKLDDAIRVGLIHRSGIPLSAAGMAFAAAIRARVAAK